MMTIRAIFVVLLFSATAAFGASSPASPTVLPSVAALQANPSPAQYPYVQLLGYNAGTTVGGGFMYWNASSTAAIDHCTIFAVSGFSTGRYIRPLSGALTPQMCGAYGDGSHNDATAANYAVAFIVANSGHLEFPCSVYNIGSALTISSGAANFQINGQARGCVTITQTSNATPIFEFTGNANAFRIHDFIGTWSTQQTTSNDPNHRSAVIEGYGSSSNSVFNFEVDHIYGINGSRMLSGNGASSNTLIWGVNFHDNIRYQTMTGSMIYDVGAAGDPRVTITNNYIQLGTINSESMFTLAVISELAMDQNEIDGLNGVGTEFDLSANPIISLTSISSGHVNGTHIEDVYTKNAGDAILVASGSTAPVSITFAADTIALHQTTLSNALGIGYSTANRLGIVTEINGEAATAYPGSLGYVYPYGVANNKTVISSVQGIDWEGPSGANGHFNTVSTGASGSSTALPIMDYDIQPPNCTAQTTGTSPIALTMTSCGTQEISVTVGTNTVVNAPTTGYDDGTLFYFVRDAATPGAGTITWNGGSGAQYVCAAATRCFAALRAKGTNSASWVLVNAGTLP